MKRMISICLLLFASVATWAQDNELLRLDTLEIRKSVQEKKGGKWVKFHYKVIVPSDSPQLEEICCSLLTGNNDFKTLKEYCSYQQNRYKHPKKQYKYYNYTRSDYLLVQPIFLPAAERFQTFHISKYYGGLRTTYTRIFASPNEEYSVDYTVIYDIKEKKVLALDDVFVSDKVKKIEEENGDGFVSMIMGSKTIQYGRNPTSDNITRLTYTDIGDQLTESFKKAINFDSLVAEYKLQQEKEKEEQEKQRNAHISDLTIDEGESAQSDIGGELKVEEVMADTQIKEEGIKVFDVVEQMPLFPPCTYEIPLYLNGKFIRMKKVNTPAGAEGLMQYLNDHVKYPAIAEENGIQGRVVCQFTVEKDGSINNVHVMRSVDPSLDKEAIRVLKQMPKWVPGKQKGEPVRVKYTVPVQFRLQ